ncbi:hypothetical protein CI238_13259 [Colletotrichum incanum]|uniref:Uncharacterized protein n=1 Tax=Colletotrichum incanum TaxID=1573173 RepID=A0A167CBF0_COLIC|nr:hypothetical protein CI238_13259 [Colletotrichum incanum]OHW99349.1 hypothetical protein CSPAE12_01935 [Colletotrichum incanum]
MTPQKCIVLVQGRRYSGVFFDTCYASDSLEATAFVPGNNCSIPCPGDARQICGGNAAALNTTRLFLRQKLRSNVLKRAAPANILLTIYELVVGLPGTTIVGPGTTIVIPPTTIIGPGVTVPGPGVTVVAPTIVSLPGSPAGPGVTVFGPGATVVAPTTVSLPGSPAGTAVADVPTTAVGPGTTVVTTNGIIVTQPPSAPGPVVFPSLRNSDGAITSLVTTITYTTVDPTKPTVLVPVELCTTLYFKDCQCPTQVVPTVPMATYVAECAKCGGNGQSKVTLTIPMDLRPNNSPGGNSPAVVVQSLSQPSKIISPIFGAEGVFTSQSVNDSPNASKPQGAQNAPSLPFHVQHSHVTRPAGVPTNAVPEAPPGLTLPGPNSQGATTAPASPSLLFVPSDAQPTRFSPSTVVVAGAQAMRYSFRALYVVSFITCLVVFRFI